MSLKRTIRRIFFPEKCRDCGEIIPISKDRCDCSLIDRTRLSDYCCEHCGSEKELCTCHLTSSPFLIHITAPFLYSGTTRKRLQDFKFNGKTDEAEFFGREMSRRFSRIYPNAKADYVTFVPSTEEKQKSRGYNQSELLANVIGKELETDVATLLFKTRETHDQHSLMQFDRLTNLNNAFSPNEKYDIREKTVILVDDIKTTGTTLKMCSNVLYACGAREVFCLCAATTEYFTPFGQVIIK